MGNCPEHDDAAQHREWLQPKELVTTNDAQVERADERATTEGDRCLHPAWAGQFCVASQSAEEATALDGLDLFDVVLHLELMRVLEGFLVTDGTVDTVVLED